MVTQDSDDSQFRVPRSPFHVRSVRSSALWAGIAAALMFYFAYPLESWILPAENPGRIGGQVFRWTLAIGAWLMAGAALLLLTGVPVALAVDAGVSALAGLGMGVGGLLLTLGGSSSGWLYLIFGVLFIGSGWRSWHEFLALRAPLDGD